MFCNLASRQNLARRVASRAGNCVERRLFGNKSPYAGFLFLSAAQANTDAAAGTSTKLNAMKG